VIVATVQSWKAPDWYRLQRVLPRPLKASGCATRIIFAFEIINQMEKWKIPNLQHNINRGKPAASHGLENVFSLLMLDSWMRLWRASQRRPKAHRRSAIRTYMNFLYIEEKGLKEGVFECIFCAYGYPENMLNLQNIQDQSNYPLLMTSACSACPASLNLSLSYGDDTLEA
jgi:hypothetical protein